MSEILNDELYGRRVALTQLLYGHEGREYLLGRLPHLDIADWPHKSFVAHLESNLYDITDEEVLGQAVEADGHLRLGHAFYYNDLRDSGIYSTLQRGSSAMTRNSELSGSWMRLMLSIAISANPTRSSYVR
jgi:hypothetical protein